MDEFEVLSSLLTPASDLVTGSIATNELAFGRGGNDTLRVYTPGATELQSENVDFLFGDLFDNTAEELELIFGIQDGTNPLGILDVGPPAIGADKFVLGDANGSYYIDDITGFSSLNELFGLNDYSVIYDFNPAQDTIQLSGSPEDYVLVEINNLQNPAVSQPFFGEAIFSRQGLRLDLVTYVISTPEVQLNLRDDNFEYVSGTSSTSLPEIKQIGTPSIDRSYGSATDSAGNLYVTGSTTGSLAGSQGGSDVWVAKFDRQGNELFRRQLGSADGDSAFGIVVDDQDNFYLSGTTSGNLFGTLQSSESDAWVAKFDSNGNQIWANQFGANLTDGSGNSSFDLDVDDSGSVYVSGLAIKENQDRETFNFTAEDDSFVVKFDSNGNQQWFTEFDTPAFNESYGVSVDGQGNVYTTGWTQGLVRPSDPSRLVQNYDYWLSKLDADSGQILFTEQFNSSNEGLEFAWDVETDSQGNAYVTGWTTGNLDGRGAGSYDPWLAKYNPDGTQEWIRQFGTGGDDGLSIASFDIDSEDNIYVTGYTDRTFGGFLGGVLGGFNQGSYDTWVVKYDSAGNEQWTQQLGSSDLEYGTDVAVNEFDELFVTGFTNGSLGATNSGAEDAWVAKLDARSGSIESFGGDISGSTGQVGVVDDIDGDNGGNNNNQISESALLDSLGNVFDPDSANTFTDTFATALAGNTDEVEFEDENGAELNDSEIEELEGVGDDDNDDDDGVSNGGVSNGDDDD